MNHHSTSTLEECEAEVQSLRVAVYSMPDPSSDLNLFQRLVEAEKRMAELYDQSHTSDAAISSLANPSTVSASVNRLGLETTSLEVDIKLHMHPLPTGIYHALDPHAHALVTVSIRNGARDTRRLRVTCFLEGLSARAVKTLELAAVSQTSIPMHPTLLPQIARQMSEVQWATLHVVVDILGNLNQRASVQSPEAELCECHNTFPILCLARTSSFNGVQNLGTGKPVDLTRYYAAWVTPYAESVQERIRYAATLCPAGRLWGYQRAPGTVAEQVEALYNSCKAANLTYINSVIDYGAAPGQATQRTRLPRESLAQKSANCIDGTVLMASLLEGVSLSPALVLVPGHAFVGWETWKGSGQWSYLETTLMGNAPFDAATQSAQSQFAMHEQRNPQGIRRFRISDLRRDGIFPME